MKKLLVLVLVLGITSMASAVMSLQISVNGNKDPVDSEIVLEPSQVVELDIWNRDRIIPGVGEGYFFLSVNTQLGRISATPFMNSNYPVDAEIIGESALADGLPVPAGEDGPWGGIGMVVAPEIPAGSTILYGIMFHCEGPGDVIVTLYETDFSSAWVLDQVTIHQIPEPASMLLLGLGGLLLRRRK